MDSINNCKRRDKMENELIGIRDKLRIAKRIKTNQTSWLLKKEEDFKVWLEDNDMKALSYRFL